MKLFFSEFKPNYDSYSFPYQVWLLREENDVVEPIYQAGFLPTRHLPNVYYLSRSLRVNLPGFDLSSENRRIINKTQEISSNLASLSDFNYTPEVQKMCKDYALERFDRGVFSSQTIKSIFENKIFSHVFVFKNSNSQTPVGYAVCFINDKLLHYAYAFYNSEFIGQNLGARMMLEAVSWAKQNQKAFAYLGTCYQTQSLYKTEFKGVEFFNGFRWSGDLLELKELISLNDQDEQEYLLKNKTYLEKFYQEGLESILDKFGTKIKL